MREGTACARELDGKSSVPAASMAIYLSHNMRNKG